MGVIGWSMLVVHLGLFIYLRKKYIGKKNKAEKSAAKLKAENINLNAQIQSYKDLLGL